MAGRPLLELFAGLQRTAYYNHTHYREILNTCNSYHFQIPTKILPISKVNYFQTKQVTIKINYKRAAPYGQVGWGFGKPNLVRDVPAHGEGVKTRWSLKSLPIKTILWLYGCWHTIFWPLTHLCSVNLWSQNGAENIWLKCVIFCTGTDARCWWAFVCNCSHL